MRHFTRTIAAAGAALLGITMAGTPARAAVAPCADATGRPWCDASLTDQQRADLLLMRMTLDEKISLMAGDDLLGGPLGGFTDDWHTGTSKGVPRLGIPDVVMTDGPAGVRQGLATALPSPISIGASFDPAVARQYAGVVANEARLKGNDVVFGPGMDVLRTPLNGRAFEGFGEDPALSAAMAAPWVQAAQAEGVIAAPKHFGVYTQETDRFDLQVQVDERTLREVYLAPFEAATRAGAGMMMCAYTSVNGTESCGNQHLIGDVLRGEWGFDGMVVADFLATPNADVAANGGLELELPTGSSYTVPRLRWELIRKRVTESTIDTRVRTTLRTMFAAGLFDRAPYVLDDAAIDRAAHDAVARSVAESSITLLKNAGGVLPLAAPKKIAVIGEVADQYQGGGGSSQVRPTSVVTPRAGIKARAGAGTSVTYNAGTSTSAAASAARGADVALVFVEDEGSEFRDKTCLTLRCGKTSGVDQDQLIEAVAAANPNTVVVLETGGPVLTPWAAKVRGVVQAWYPGQQAGPALARVLYGDIDPGGRLPVTFPAAAADAPTAGNPSQFPGVGKRAVFSEGLLVGYRHYDAKALTPAFAFGSGLSYTSFRYSNLQVSGTAVTATVTNTGSRTGTAVPQLYVGVPSPDATPAPPRRLEGFDKLSLAPGASATVTFPLSDRDVSSWTSGGWRVTPGCYSVAVGPSSRELPLTARFARGIGTC